MAEVQSDKYGVSVTLESLQDGQRNVVKAAGEVTARGPQLYIRYEESSQARRARLFPSALP